ncbi:MAG TPA: mandelate racemase/muconate lactonizing enzyme family protein [Kineosporiaceae bacterium]
MRIAGYRTLTTVQAWGRPVGDANGVFEDGVLRVELVLVDTDEGITGVGMGSHTDVSRVFPAIEGEDPRATTALYDRMLRQTFKSGHNGAVFGTIGALDAALWDIKAKAAGQPLWRLLGGRDRVVPVYASGLDIALSDDQLASVYAAYAERGLRAAKLKGGLDVHRDRTRLSIVRDVLTAAHPRSCPGLMLDANESWSRKHAVRHVAALEQTMDLIWVEEPVRRWDVEGMVAVGRGVRASIATGENLTGLEQFRPLLAAGAVDVVQTASVWGVTHFLRVAALAHAHDLPVSPIGTTPVCLAHAATAVPNHMVTELQDLNPPTGLSLDLSVQDGCIVLGEEPGLGIGVDLEAMSRVDVSGAPRTTGPHIRPAHAGHRLDGHDG